MNDSQASLPRLSLRDILPPAPALAAVTLSVVEPAAQLLLSGDAAELGAAFGSALPAAGQLAGEDPLAIWQAPDRWLLVSDSRAGLTAEVAGVVQGQHALVTDFTDGLAVFEIAGPRARDLLRQGSSFDLSPQHFAVGQAAVTLFADLRVTLYPLAEDRLRLHVESASAAYIWDWLTTAATAYNPDMAS